MNISASCEEINNQIFRSPVSLRSKWGQCVNQVLFRLAREISKQTVKEYLMKEKAREENVDLRYIFAQ